MAITIQRSAFFEAVQKHHPSSTAVVNYESGTAFSYGRLLRDIALSKRRLLQKTDRESLGGERVAFLVENSYNYVVTLPSIIACNAIAVPLAPSFPLIELRYVINNSGAIALLSTERYANQAKQVLQEGIDNSVHLVQLADTSLEISNEAVDVVLTESATVNDGGMMLFTSGTTSRPKGIVLSDATLTAQAQSLLEAWRYSPSDHLLHVLPLHHIHGTVNALLVPVLAGSSIEFMFPFDVNTVWRRFASPFLQQEELKVTNGTPDVAVHDKSTPISLFTAVPTVWARMLQSYPSLEPHLQSACKKAISRAHLRLNMSGSAALPSPTREGWNGLSCGNVLLERYGMTEVGMALSCGLDDNDRILNSVGWPLPSVEARLMEKNAEGVESIIKIGEEIDLVSSKERQGEIQLRGPTIFKEYWQNPTATAKEFTEDDWFRTGDIAVRRMVDGAGSGTSGEWATGPAYFIQGRQSADIIKTGGEKVSALEIEREILALQQVNECAVVGLESQSWGQKVAAVVVLSEGHGWSLAEMRRELKTRLVAYKIPQDLEIVKSIKRNAMGKVNKKELVPAVFGTPELVRKRSVDLREAQVAAKRAAAVKAK